MPDRLIRDELLTSERYWSVSIEAQRLFIHLLLVVDDLARFSGKNFTIRSACFPGQAVAPEKVERMLSELQDVDLVRLYEVGGERFVFVPRFGQRLRYTNSKFPAPPQEISDIPVGKTDYRRTEDSPKPDPSQQKRSEEKRSEEKRSKPIGASAFELPSWVPAKPWADWVEMRKKLRKAPTVRAMELAVHELQKLASEGHDPGKVLEQSVLNGWQGLFPLKTETKKQDAWWTSEQATKAKGAELGIYPRGGESWNEFRSRIKSKLEAA